MVDKSDGAVTSSVLALGLAESETMNAHNAAIVNHDSFVFIIAHLYKGLLISLIHGCMYLYTGE